MSSWVSFLRTLLFLVLINEVYSQTQLTIAHGVCEGKADENFLNLSRVYAILDWRVCNEAHIQIREMKADSMTTIVSYNDSNCTPCTPFVLSGHDHITGYHIWTDNAGITGLVLSTQNATNVSCIGNTNQSVDYFKSDNYAMDHLWYLSGWKLWTAMWIKCIQFQFTKSSADASIDAISSTKACSAYDSITECAISSLCHWHNNRCKCNSKSQKDIIFIMDGSQYVHEDVLQRSKLWLQQVIDQETPQQSRIGIIVFANEIYEYAPLLHWNQSNLIEYIDNISWPFARWTSLSDVAFALDLAIQQFTDRSETNRDKILVLRTHSNPCGSHACPYTICQYEHVLRDNRIQSIVFGVGTTADVDEMYFECAFNHYFNVTTDDMTDVLCRNKSIRNTSEEANATTGSTLIEPNTKWTDDFQFSSSGSSGSSDNWRSASKTWNHTTASEELGALHGWFTQCDTKCSASQMNRDFACIDNTDIHYHTMVISFDVYIACALHVFDLYSGLMYSRYSKSTGLLNTKVDKNNVVSFITDTSDKSPSTCSGKIAKITVLDTLYANSSEVVFISISLIVHSDAIAVSFGHFEVLCHQSSLNPSAGPTTYAIHTSYIPSSELTTNTTVYSLSTSTTDVAVAMSVDTEDIMVICVGCMGICCILGVCYCWKGNKHKDISRLRLSSSVPRKSTFDKSYDHGADIGMVETNKRCESMNHIVLPDPDSDDEDDADNDNGDTADTANEQKEADLDTTNMRHNMSVITVTNEFNEATSVIATAGSITSAPNTSSAEASIPMHQPMMSEELSLIVGVGSLSMNSNILSDAGDGSVKLPLVQPPATLLELIEDVDESTTTDDAHFHD